MLWRALAEAWALAGGEVAAAEGLLLCHQLCVAFAASSASSTAFSLASSEHRSRIASLAIIAAGAGAAVEAFTAVPSTSKAAMSGGALTAAAASVAFCHLAVTRAGRAAKGAELPRQRKGCAGRIGALAQSRRTCHRNPLPHHNTTSPHHPRHHSHHTRRSTPATQWRSKGSCLSSWTKDSEVASEPRGRNAAVATIVEGFAGMDELSVAISGVVTTVVGRMCKAATVANRRLRLGLSKELRTFRPWQLCVAAFVPYLASVTTVGSHLGMLRDIQTAFRKA